jgi:hypothetical protein
MPHAEYGVLRPKSPVRTLGNPGSQSPSMRTGSAKAGPFVSAGSDWSESGSVAKPCTKSGQAQDEVEKIEAVELRSPILSAKKSLFPGWRRLRASATKFGRQL